MKKLLKLNLQLFADGDGDGNQNSGDQSGNNSAFTEINKLCIGIIFDWEGDFYYQITWFVRKQFMTISTQMNI
ncbi:hypothetical protein [Lactiplantibacillus paraxiangfangensis]|uniref:hypothetical protein n=1 Tax=Lactiplantibacillus paraxiangfangensis TaxID=3076224 RepID=UPI0030C75EE3